MRGKNHLSDKAIKAALKQAAEAGKAVAINDGAGLTLEAQPTGVGWWRLRYYIDGKANRQSLGTYPDVSLSDARARRDAARQDVAAGHDPSQVRKAEKAARAQQVITAKLAAEGKPGPGTFEFVAREWLTTMHMPKVSVSHAKRTQDRLEKSVFPWIGRQAIDAIEAPELLQVLRKIEARGAIETAHRTKDACGQVFRYGVACGVCKRNPAADLKDALRPVEAKHHAAIIDPKELGQLLRAMADYQGNTVTRAALSLSALLLLRPGELRHMEWAWLDLDGATLTVPPEVMKRSKADKRNGVPHIVPLAHQAVSILRDLQAETGHRSFVFPSLASPQRCMSENTVRSALRRMGYGNEDMTAHGFRATARTMIAERLEIAPEVIEAQLAHAVPDALGRAYNRTQYLEQRRAMMQQWADYLDRLKSGAQVLSFKAA